MTTDYGRGFSEKSLRHMLRFAEAFPDERIVSALMRQLSWTHFLSVIYLPDPLQRDFYAEMCRMEGWSTRALQKKIASMLYERTALSRKPEELALLEVEALREKDETNRHSRKQPEKTPTTGWRKNATTGCTNWLGPQSA